MKIWRQFAIVELKDSGKIFASFKDYKITEKDDFVRNPDSLPISAAPPIKQNIDDIKSSVYTKAEISAAKEVAEKYYANFTGEREIVAINYTENSDLLSYGVSPKYADMQIIIFEAYEKSVPDIPRTIFLARENNEQRWIVINEGY